MATPARTDDPTCFAVRAVTAGARRCLVLTGDLDALAAPLLDEHVLAALTSADVTHLELDLSHVTFLGAAGVRSLVLAQRTADRSGRVLQVQCGSRRAVLRPLQLTGLLAPSTVGDRRA